MRYHAHTIPLWTEIPLREDKENPLDLSLGLRGRPWKEASLSVLATASRTLYPRQKVGCTGAPGLQTEVSGPISAAPALSPHLKITVRACQGPQSLGADAGSWHTLGYMNSSAYTEKSGLATTLKGF